MKTQIKTFLAFVFSLFVARANATWCYSCDKPIPSGSCPEKQEFCWAGEGACCFTKNVYIGRTRIKSVVGCIPEYKNARTQNSDMWHEVICCFTDYCNA